MFFWRVGWVIIVLAACGGNETPQSAEMLLHEVQTQAYRTWERAPGCEERKATNAPHSDFVDIYVNEPLAQAARSANTSSWPLGSVVVKDGFDTDGELEIIAIMEKREDGWFYAEYDAQGDVDYSGQPSVCLSCHAAAPDAILAFPLPN